MKKFAFILVTIVFVVSASAVSAESASSKENAPVVLKIIDLAIVRPVSAVVATGLTGVCIGSMPLAYVAGVGEESARILVEAPWRFTGARYLGDFHNYKDGEPITTLPGN
jgi:hypothetical protein